MKYMLDTNMCIYAQKKNESVLAKLKEHWQEEIAISLITLDELEYGVKASAAPEQNAIALMKFLSIVEILPYDTGAAEEYGNICAFLGKKGTPIGTMDMLISAHAKPEGLIVVTHNTKEFERVHELKLEDWFE